MRRGKIQQTNWLDPHDFNLLKLLGRDVDGGMTGWIRQQLDKVRKKARKAGSLPRDCEVPSG